MPRRTDPAWVRDGPSLGRVRRREIWIQPSFDYSLAGEHQLDNLATVQETLKQIPLRLNDHKSREGIAHTAMLTGLRARLEDFPYEPARQKGVRLLLDVAHNPHAFEQLREYFQFHSISPAVVAGFAKDKDVLGSLDVIRDFAFRFVAVAASMSRAMPVSDLLAYSTSLGMKPERCSNIVEAVNAAISSSKVGDTVLLTGSHYIVGEFLKDVPGA